MLVVSGHMGGNEIVVLTKARTYGIASCDVVVVVFMAVLWTWFGYNGTWSLVNDHKVEFHYESWLTT